MLTFDEVALLGEIQKVGSSRLVHDPVFGLVSADSKFRVGVQERLREDRSLPVVQLLVAGEGAAQALFGCLGSVDVGEKLAHRGGGELEVGEDVFASVDLAGDDDSSFQL